MASIDYCVEAASSDRFDLTEANVLEAPEIAKGRGHLEYGLSDEEPG